MLANNKLDGSIVVKSCIYTVSRSGIRIFLSLLTSKLYTHHSIALIVELDGYITERSGDKYANRK